MHPNLRISKLTISGTVCFILFIADRILKYYFLENPAVKIGGDFFSLHFVRNYGIAFGLGITGLPIIILVIIILIFLTYLIVDAYRSGKMMTFISSGLIITGAISNLIDRLKVGFVIDYIDVAWFTVFNLADSAITVGALLLAISFWRTDNKNSTTLTKSD